jgi:geranylgeranyl diphosphate synthase, type I
MNLQSALEQTQLEMKYVLHRFFEAEKKRASQVDKELVESIEMLAKFCLRGGKAVSPLLLNIAYTVAGGKDHENLLLVMAAIELHHKHLLILDDIADRDEVRYNGPTLEYMYRHELDKYNRLFPDPSLSLRDHRARSLAMLDGVLLGGLARKLLFQAGFDPKMLIECHNIMQDTMLADTLAGWKVHYYQNIVSIEAAGRIKYIKGLELVTAHYKFSAPFRIGLLLAGNENTSYTKAFEEYAKNIGIAFQVHDDILGLFGDPLVTGKPAGNDVREGKKTLLIQKAYRPVNYENRKFLDIVVGNPTIAPIDIERVQKMVQETGSLVFSQKYEQQLLTKGLTALRSLPDGDEKTVLTELAKYVVERTK